MRYEGNIKRGGETTSNKMRLPKVMSKNQLLKLVGMTDDVRLFTVVYLGVFLALRIGESANLQWHDIDFDNKTLLVRDGKNTKRHKSNYGKDRKVVIVPQFITFLKMLRSMNPKEKYVIPHKTFTDRDEHNGRGVLGMKKFCQDLLKKTLKKADLLEVDYYQRNGRPRYTFKTHTLRHVAGCNMVRMGVHIEQIRRQLGHAEITDTRVYFQLVPEDTREELEKRMNKHLKKNQEISSVTVTEDLVRIQQEKIRLLELELLERELKEKYQNGYLSEQTIRA